MPRRAKDEPFSRCRSATSSTRSSSWNRAPKHVGQEVDARDVHVADASRAARRAGLAVALAGPLAVIVRERFLDQHVGGFGQDRVLGLAVDGLAADLQHDRHGERRDPRAGACA